MKPKLFRSIFILLASYGLIYLVFAFAQWNIYPGAWDGAARGACMLVGTFMSGVFLFVFNYPE